jgi:nicotinate-nucleotide adenylyltransferase
MADKEITENRKKRIALFGGTFDPPHVGHVQVVLTVLERNLADEVWIVLTRQNSFKQGPLFSFETRRSMVQSTFSSIPRIKIVCEENEFTIDTVRFLKKEHKEISQGELFFIIGSDVFHTRKNWKEWDSVVQEGTFLVINRFGMRPDPELFEERLKSLVVDVSRFDISSSEIRKYFLEDKYISHLVHPDVEQLMVNAK